MNETYSGRRQSRSSRSSKPQRGAIKALLIKQSAAAIICTGILFAMHSMPNPAISRYADALGNAMHSESDLTPLKEAWESFTSRFKKTTAPQLPPEIPSGGEITLH